MLHATFSIGRAQETASPLRSQLSPFLALYSRSLEICSENLGSSSVNLNSGREKKIKKLITGITLGNKLQEWDFSLKP